MTTTMVNHGGYRFAPPTLQGWVDKGFAMFKIVMVTSLIVLTCSVCSAEEIEHVDDIRVLYKDSKPDVISRIQDVLDGWRAMFGDIKFEDPLLFNSMVYIHPQPNEKFLPLNGKKIDKSVKDMFVYWMGVFFFRDLRDELQVLDPVMYFLAGKKNRSDLLMYIIKTNEYKISILESDSAYLFIVKPVNYNFSNGLKYLDVKNFLSELRLDGNGLKTKSRDTVLLPRILPVGTILGSSELVFHETENSVGWENKLQAFVSREGLCVLLFKQNKNAANTSLSGNYRWLAKNLENKD